MITNNINSNNFCKDCGKKYTRKYAFEKHSLVCGILHKSKRENKLEDEELEELPSQRQMYEIIKELTFKYDKLEKKQNEMEKYFNKNKKKINILEWLNNSENCIYRSSYIFIELINKINVNENHIQILIDHNFSQSITQIFNDNFIENKETIPICCFSQKNNVFYICNFKNETITQWCELEKKDLIRFLNLVQKKMLLLLNEWKIINQEKIRSSDKWAETYNKSLIKCLVSFTDDNILCKMKTILFNILKIDCKNLIEYEFEF